MAILPQHIEDLQMSKLTLVLLSNITTDAFGGNVPEEARQDNWVGFTQDGSSYLIAGRTYGDSGESVKAHFDNDTDMMGFIESGLPLELFAMMGGHSLLTREALGDNVLIQELAVYGESEA